MKIEYLEDWTIEELEAKKTTKQYLKIFEIDNDILEEAELICTKVLRQVAQMDLLKDADFSFLDLNFDDIDFDLNLDALDFDITKDL